MAVFGWQNNVLTSSIATSSSVPGLDAAQLQNEHGSPATALQTAGTAVSLWLDSGSAATVWRAIGLFRTNLTPGATWRVIVWSGTQTSPGTALYRYGDSTPMAAMGIVSGTGVHIAPADVTGRSVQIDISDPGNPDGFLNIPLLFAGPVWQPRINFGPESALGRDSEADETTTRGGQEYVAYRWTRLRHDVALDGLASDEIWPAVMAMDMAGRRGMNVLYVPDPDSPDRAAEAIYGRLKSTADVTYPAHPNPVRAWRASITTRL